MQDTPEPARAPLDPLRVLARAWKLLLVTAVLGALAGGLLVTVRSTSWSSTSTIRVVVTPEVNPGQNQSNTAVEDPARVVATQRDLVLSDAVVNQVAAALKITPDAVRNRTTVLADTVADTLAVSAKGPTAVDAQNLTREVATIYIATVTDNGRAQLTTTIQNYTQELATLQQEANNKTLPAFETASYAAQYAALSTTQTQLTSQLAAYTGPASIITNATLPQSPDSLGRSKAVGAGLALGLLIAISIALLRATRSERLTWVSDIVAEAALPLLAEVPFSRELAGAANKVRLAPIESGDVAEAARGMAVALAGDAGLRTVLVTSPGRYDGKTTVAAQLASASGLAGLRVILILADARSRAAVNDIPPMARGLTDLIAEGPGGGSVGVPSGYEGVTIVPVGARAAQARDLLRGPRLARALQHLATQADLVIIDAPATTAPETSTLAMAVDGVLLCIGTHDARRTVIRDTVAGLRAVSHRLLGVVVVDVEGRVRPEHSDYPGFDTTPAPMLEANVVPAEPRVQQPTLSAELTDEALGGDDSDQDDHQGLAAVNLLPGDPEPDPDVTEPSLAAPALEDSGAQQERVEESSAEDEVSAAR